MHPAVALAGAIEQRLKAKDEEGFFGQAVAIGKSFFFEHERKKVAIPTAVVRVMGHEGAPDTRAKNKREITAIISLSAPASDSLKIEAALNLSWLFEQAMTDPEARRLGAAQLVRWDVPDTFDEGLVRTASLYRQDLTFVYALL